MLILVILDSIKISKGAINDGDHDQWRKTATSW